MKLKIIIFMSLIVLFTIFVTQNTLVIPVDIFLWQVEMSVIVLITLALLIGMIMGFILLKILEHKEKKSTTVKTEPPRSKEGSKRVNL